MFLVSVSGACSRSGKTALAETLIRGCPRGSALAVKFTTTEEVFKRCPRGTACVVCHIDVPYRIVTDEATLREPGTDTDRLAAAGAGRVIWAIARQSAVPRAWDAVGAMLGGASCVVMEGTTIVDLAHPDLHMFVVHPFLSPTRWKARSEHFIRKADAVLVNRPSKERRSPSAAVMGCLRGLRPRADIRIADVTHPIEEWAPDLHGLLTTHARVSPLGRGPVCAVRPALSS